MSLLRQVKAVAHPLLRPEWKEGAAGESCVTHVFDVWKETAQKPQEKQKDRNEEKTGRARGLLPDGFDSDIIIALPVEIDDVVVNPHAEEIASGKLEGSKYLASLQPKTRRAVLERIKLDYLLIGLAEKVKKQGDHGSLKKRGLPEVEHGMVDIEIQLNSHPADFLKKLQARGFRQDSDHMLCGRIDVNRLDALIELRFVRFVTSWRVPRPGEDGGGVTPGSPE
jgi:hypothetical protein